MSTQEQTRTETTDSVSEDEQSEMQSICKDTQFGMLKNRRRRDILCYLRENGGESTLSDLAEFIAAKENDVERRLLSSDERKRVYIGIYQCHLPKMDDAGVIDFDKRSGDVTLEPASEQLFQYLDQGTDDDADEEPSDTGLTIPPELKLSLGWTPSILAVLSVIGFSLIPPVGLFGLVVSLLLAASVTVDALPTVFSPEE